MKKSFSQSEAFDDFFTGDKYCIKKSVLDISITALKWLLFFVLNLTTVTLTDQSHWQGYPVLFKIFKAEVAG